MPKICQECGHKLIGSEDKKFCDDGCRNQFHNNRYRQRRRRKDGKIYRALLFFFGPKK
ncbi:MAG: DUF2116 family Zn-ribbon domain-containing protein [Bacteroidetes bacterium]|nr:DUF2116 family Zn-ribbon domain-containing protein [Bacteroidota bacterium]